MTDTPLFYPHGFKFSACAAGLKRSGKLDLALITSDTVAACAGVFTRNKVVAAPVVVSRDQCRTGQCRAVVINAGNANACTGEPGLKDAKEMQSLTASLLDLPANLVSVSSTGIIGQPLPMDLLREGLPQVVAGLNGDDALSVAEAIRTTDAFSKVASCEVETADGPYRILGLAKGAGMIHPDMGTMLAYILTDANLPAEQLQTSLQRATDRSFNAITVDGDTSTNDTVLLLANGQSGVNVEGHYVDAFDRALDNVLTDLAKMIVRDGEGATKLVTIEVAGAACRQDAVVAARAIATSSLVKTAFFGQDPNWGRIIAALGYSGAQVDPDKVAIFFDDVPVFKNGLALGESADKKAALVLTEPEFTVRVELNVGEGEAFYYTSDLSYDYVRINAEYHT